MSALELERLSTHDSIFGRGHLAGYVRAKIEDRASFATDILASQVDLVMGLLSESDARVVVGKPERRVFCVNWTRLEVTFP